MDKQYIKSNFHKPGSKLDIWQRFESNLEVEKKERKGPERSRRDQGDIQYGDIKAVSLHPANPQQNQKNPPCRGRVKSGSALGACAHRPG